MEEPTKSVPVRMYAHPACPMVGPIRGMLKHSKVEFEYINIHQDDAGRQRVREINHGLESVPTLVFPDGSTLTEPSVRVLKQKLEALGYTVPLTALLRGNMWLIIVALGILLALLRGAGVF